MSIHIADRTFGLSCNNLFLKSCKSESLNMVQNPRRKRSLKRGLFLDICILHEAKNLSDGCISVSYSY